MSSKPVIAITAGDVAGIGPEVVVRSLRDERVTAACRPLVICHPDVLRRAAELTGDDACVIASLSAPFDRQQFEHSASGPIVCVNPAGDDARDVEAGVVSAAAGDAAFRYLKTAIGLAREKSVDAIATAPLNKAALRAAGHDFPGHTEILADECNVASYAMMLHLPESRLDPFRRLAGFSMDRAKHGISIAHVTLHTSVESVAGLLTQDSITERVRLMDDFLQRIGCDRRAIAVCALNPHGGENGLFGDEEQRLIVPAIQRVSDRLNVTGPLPVDTLMRRAFGGEFDGVVAMYHDQGHIPVKLIAFDAAVNITLGLPIIRTSPTHGTAFDRAWNSALPADPAGMVEAIVTAARLQRQR